MLTFVDITSRKEATQSLQAAHEQLGFAQQASQSLRGMHERAAMVSGTVDIESAPGKGTTAIVQMPLRGS